MMTKSEMKTNDTMQKTTSTMNDTNKCVLARTCGSHAPSRMRSHDAKRVALSKAKTQMRSYAPVRRRAWSGLPPPAILWGAAMTRSSNTSGCVAALAATDGTTAVTDGTTALGALATLATLATTALASAALATTALAATLATVPLPPSL